MKLPPSFKASSEGVLSSLVVDRLERVMPETETPVAIRQLEEASLLLSLCRSFQGITASADQRLIPIFDSVLQGELSKDGILDLQGLLASEKEYAAAGSEAEVKAQRVKGIYHLAMAASAKRC
jgi:hypothetical protein